MAPIERITLFKVPKEEDRQRLLEQYKVLAKTATKVRIPRDSPALDTRVLCLHHPFSPST
jgi:hypothetical protein